MYYCDSFRFFALFTVYFFGKGSQSIIPLHKAVSYEKDDSRPCDSLPDKLGLADVVMLQPPGEVGVFFLGHAGLDYMAAVGRVVSLG